VNPEEEKERLWLEGFAEKVGFKTGMNPESKMLRNGVTNA